MPDIELNDLFRRALDVMENSGRNVFITGKAGTGKSTLLEYFRNTTQKRIAVVAPTGVAALNVGGQTLHSFCRFKPDITLDKVKKVSGERADLYKKLDAVVVDEVSMVRADVMDCAEKFLRLNGPDRKRLFGGIQMIFIGDLYQLPPVVTSREKEAFRLRYETPYFFSSGAFGHKDFDMEFIELAWAVTIHKSQGKTFNKVIIDIGRGAFAHGQVYVALSRSTNFKGIVLKKEIRKEHIWMDWNVVRFLTRFQYKKADESMSLEEKKRLIRRAIKNGGEIDIVYLKPDDTKSRRRILPEAIEKMVYKGKEFEGLRAWCHLRGDKRHFRIDRILEIGRVVAASRKKQKDEASRP